MSLHQLAFAFMCASFVLSVMAQSANLHHRRMIAVERRRDADRRAAAAARRDAQ